MTSVQKHSNCDSTGASGIRHRLLYSTLSLRRENRCDIAQPALAKPDITRAKRNAMRRSSYHGSLPGRGLRSRPTNVQLKMKKNPINAATIWSSLPECHPRLVIRATPSTMGSRPASSVSRHRMESGNSPWMLELYILGMFIFYSFQVLQKAGIRVSKRMEEIPQETT